ncbi:hypothetical protein JCM9279_002250 [Rhodotorula babjevae]
MPTLSSAAQDAPTRNLAPDPVPPTEQQPEPVQRRTWLNPLPRQIPVVDRLSKLPLELVYLVLSFLDPPSLLALSCTSRPWLALLRRPSAHTHERTKRVWAQARDNARVPQLESDLGGGEDGEIAHEVLLARLLGGWACQVSGGEAARDEDVDFDARVRLCSTCRTSLFATTQELSDAYFHLHPRTLDCVFRTSTHDPDVHHPQFEYRYFVADALAVSAHLYFLEADVLAQGKKGAEVLGEYVRERLMLRAQVRRDADKLKAWWTDTGQALTPLLHSIFEKLDNLGFEGYDFDYLFWDDPFHDPLLLSSSPGETSSQADERERLNDDLDRFIDTSDPLGEEEWRDWKPRVVAWVFEQQRGQRKSARDDARIDLARLHPLVKRCVGIEVAPLVPPLNSFLRLPSLEAMWADGEHYLEGDDVDDVLPAATVDAVEAMRNDRLVLLDRLARTLFAEGDPLPPSILSTLASSRSPFIDRDPRTGIEPAYLAVPPADVNAVLERATAVFRCGICGLLAPVAQLVPHVHASQGSRAPPRCIVAPAQVRALVREAVGPTASIGECDARGRVWELEGRTVEMSEDSTTVERAWKEGGLTWGEVLQHSLVDVSTLAIGPALVARWSSDSTSARSPTSTSSALEPTDLAKDGKKVRILGSFDLGDDTVKTYVCA